MPAESEYTGRRQGEREEQEFDLKGLLHHLLRYLWLPALLGLVGGAVSIWYTRDAPVTFRSTAVIQVEPEAKRQVRIADDGEQDLKSPENVQTIVENFRNRSLMQRVAAALNLAKDPRFAGPNAPISEENVTRFLLRNTNAVIRPKTRLIDVTAFHTDPVLVRKIADALVDEFLKQIGEQRYKALEAQNSVLVQKARELQLNVEQAEAESQTYLKNEGATSLDESRQLVTAKLTTLSSQLITARGEARQIKSDLEQIQKAGSDQEALLAIGVIARDPAVIAGKERIVVQETVVASQAQSYRDKHPIMIEARSQLANMKESLSGTIRQLLTILENERAAAAKAEEILAQAVSEQEKIALELDQKLVGYRRLQREVESNRAMYEAVAQQLKQSTLALGIEPIAFRIVEPAAPAIRPPSQRMYMVIGAAFGGLFLGLSAAAALFILDTSIRSVDDAERHLNLPVLAAVPSVRNLKTEQQSLAILHQPASPAAESFRSLRTSLTLSGPELQSKVVLVTSAIPGEGKTITSSNIAVAFAQQGLRTLLIDADLRRPSINKVFQIHPRSSGLSDALLGHPLEMVSTAIPNLTVLPAGTKSMSPAELLKGAAMSELLARLSKDFTRIVIDTAPVNIVSDTLNFAEYANAVCLVVRSGKTPKRVVLRAVELLRRAKVRSIGVALNRLPEKNGQYYYHYSSNEKYGGDGTYGGGYQGAEAPPLAKTVPSVVVTAQRSDQPSST